MPAVTDFYMRTTHAPASVEQTLRARLRAHGIDPDVCWIDVNPASEEDRESSLGAYGLEPTVSASMQAREGHSDAAVEAAILATAHELGAELVVFYTDTLLFAYAAGTVHPSPAEREYYEQQVLPGFPGRVDWSKPLPWQG